ncbi:MAG: endonuclease/exonuclease/phosphatase family protein [Planctomycetaceae bacterium]|nr:endonuclease/exonuclease/phosphatase family protein [Planctomycetaceae bacterium]
MDFAKTGARLWLALPGFVACAATVAAAEAPRPAAPFTVVTYNIRYDNPDDGPNIWTNRREAMVKYLRETKADLIGMQEVLPQQRDFLAEHLAGYAVYSVGRDDGIKGEATPIFYRTERFELLDKGTFWLSDSPDKPGSKGWDAGLPRVVSWVKLRDKLTGKPLLAVNTHFDNRGVQARLESAKLLVRKIDELDGDKAGALPVVLTGDFNCMARQEPYRVLAGQPGESVKLIDAQFASRKPHAGGESTSNGFKEIRAGAKIDFIFVRGLSVESHQIDDPRVDGRFVSDHQPVQATLAW